MVGILATGVGAGAHPGLRTSELAREHSPRPMFKYGDRSRCHGLPPGGLRETGVARPMNRRSRIRLMSMEPEADEHGTEDDPRPAVQHPGRETDAVVGRDRCTTCREDLPADDSPARWAPAPDDRRRHLDGRRLPLR